MLAVSRRTAAARLKVFADIWLNSYPSVLCKISANVCDLLHIPMLFTAKCSCKCYSYSGGIRYGHVLQKRAQQWALCYGGRNACYVLCRAGGLWQVLRCSENMRTCAVAGARATVLRRYGQQCCAASLLRCTCAYSQVC
ncbi:hypothetical protein NPIL_197621 [Nephila pilipes]|uniref:Uncharacterized protein n=1 Tax=Nephila pilipes TaxID=299642 RepID=A0A8X6QQ81_NEPPI|nr:hypothetical protein NPIL_197621 [Nephila pilipes]